jgi:hypothetical protein
MIDAFPKVFENTNIHKLKSTSHWLEETASSNAKPEGTKNKQVSHEDARTSETVCIEKFKIFVKCSLHFWLKSGK